MRAIRQSVTHPAEKATSMGYKSSCRGMPLCLMDKDNSWKLLGLVRRGSKFSSYPISVRPRVLVENGLARLLKVPVSEKSW